MTQYISFRLKSGRTTFGFSVLFLAAFMAMFFVGSAVASQGVSFSWQGSPESTVSGYRLYYGGQSRAGSSISGEEYEYFLDLASWERCSTDPNRPACETLREDEVTCSNIDGTRPECTIKGLPGGSTFFAVTAYSLWAESDYSTEINAQLDSLGNLATPSAGPRPMGPAGHIAAVSKLLLSNNTSANTTGNTGSSNTGTAERTPRVVITKVFGDTPDSTVPGTIEDTYIKNDTDNYVSNSKLRTYTWPENQVANAILLKFNLSQIPTNAQIISASLKLYQIGAGGDRSYTLTAHKVINHNPVLSQCSGYTYNGRNRWTANDARSSDNIPMAQADLAAPAASISTARTDGYKSWEIKQIVTDWLRNPAANYGLLINSDGVAGSNSYRTFASTDNSNAAFRPMLVVKYYQ